MNYTAALRTMPPPSPRPPPPSQAAGPRYFAMDAVEDAGEAPAAVRPAPLLEVMPQAGIGRHCGSGYELVLDATVPQLGRGVVEKLVDTLRLMLMVAALRDSVRGGEDGKERKKRKRRKKKLPKTSSSFLRRGGAWNEGIMHEYAEGDTEDVANKEVSGVFRSGGDCSFCMKEMGKFIEEKVLRGEDTHPQDQTACLELVR